MLDALINNKNKKLTTFLNPFSYFLVRRDGIRLDDFNIEIDGGLLVHILNIFGISCKRKSFDMTSMAPIVFNNAIKNNKSVYFVGTRMDVIDLAIKNIQKEFPELNILGYHDGYISERKKVKILKDINNLNIDYVICGMGTPLQEQFLLSLQASGWSGTGYTCGGFLHQTASQINYYPYWINRLGLRAFYRMYDEPKLVKRYFIDYPKAIVIIFYDLIKYRLS
tara:strand:- start:1833 stop:2501 length:669 start_codon:yes stop_codon:yes gene_type:complete